MSCCQISFCRHVFQQTLDFFPTWNLIIDVFSGRWNPEVWASWRLSDPAKGWVCVWAETKHQFASLTPPSDSWRPAGNWRDSRRRLQLFVLLLVFISSPPHNPKKIYQNHSVKCEGRSDKKGGTLNGFLKHLTKKKLCCLPIDLSTSTDHSMFLINWTHVYLDNI